MLQSTCALILQGIYFLNEESLIFLYITSSHSGLVSFSQREMCKNTGLQKLHLQFIYQYTVLTTHLYTSTHSYTYTSIHIQTPTHPYTYTSIHIQTPTHPYTCTFIQLHIHTPTHSYTSIHLHIHTHSCTYTSIYQYTVLTNPTTEETRSPVCECIARKGCEAAQAAGAAAFAREAGHLHSVCLGVCV